MSQEIRTVVFIGDKKSSRSDHQGEFLVDKKGEVKEMNVKNDGFCREIEEEENYTEEENEKEAEKGRKRKQNILGRETWTKNKIDNVDTANEDFGGDFFLDLFANGSNNATRKNCERVQLSKLMDHLQLKRGDIKETEWNNDLVGMRESERSTDLSLSIWSSSSDQDRGVLEGSFRKEKRKRLRKVTVSDNEESRKEYHGNAVKMKDTAKLRQKEYDCYSLVNRENQENCAPVHCAMRDVYKKNLGFVFDAVWMGDMILLSKER